ncbi:interferon alpha-inducible protein 27-like protein 2A isoform X1 [Coturnix japonica]|nr:interferon alpha-inducible protein 27-like protein 2A isoform X1 [Coturnix japonica]
MAKSRREAGGDAGNRCQRSSTPGTSRALQWGTQWHEVTGGLGTRRVVNPIIKAVIGSGVATGVALVGVPLTIWSLGFTAAGITAGSIAAKMMSAAAIANGGGVAAGSVVAVLQSVGAVGLSIGAKLGLASVFGPVGALIGSKIP